MVSKSKPVMIFEKGQTVRVNPQGLERLTAAGKRGLADRRGIVQSAFVPEGRASQVVSVQWLAKDNVTTFGLPGYWAPKLLELVDAVRVSPKSEDQKALERSELWKLFQAIAARPECHDLLKLAREANAEFIRHRTPHQLAG